MKLHLESKLLFALAVFVLAFSIAFLFSQRKKNSQPSKDLHPYPELMEQEFLTTQGRKVALGNLGIGYKIIFFGTLYGSEISPAAIENLAGIQSYRFRHPITAIFITLDPERDTEELIDTTFALYGAPIIPLRGHPESIQNLAEKFGVRWKKVEIPGSRLKYSIDSSPWMYFTTPDYRILGAYPVQIRKERLRMEVEAHMKRKDWNP